MMIITVEKFNIKNNIKNNIKLIVLELRHNQKIRSQSAKPIFHHATSANYTNRPPAM
ncbi:hypothetical protein HGI38_25715 [Clostridium beijerinckii]|jgi:hypothetical protein|uniref:Uncharacterized protein n=1 Tax=Clostridium beijerinckii TaxID=1520 RepID=A0A9Q5GPL6_CLOBE|nr:hypothetical protein [Clostridium beijerinckii]MBA2888571.1 hypothetical protein [Clostridium beijerinckii]MBA2902974.1 hypothetical protein [Clostridium beijerinckii]MBA2913184.1 hypothetical protein [Clostridium beijerinckii]MBA9015315.1 hypothetical protein [Clostridium beijerinckii]MBC2420043.1 hypothetical protein [Clostridium beijerinckii]